MQQVFADAASRRLMNQLTGALVLFLCETEAVFAATAGRFSQALLAFWLVLAALVLGCVGVYLARREAQMTEAAEYIRRFLAGETDLRLDCNAEGGLYRLYHEVNTLAAVLNAHLHHESREKENLKSTMEDISHQLKTPLAALNIYNGLLQDAAGEPDAVREFAALSEQELDRMERLVQNLLKLARLDADAVAFAKKEEPLPEMMDELEQSFATRAKQEGKTLVFSGEGDITLPCDRVWLLEAFRNLVKNALDHTGAEDSITVHWCRFGSIVQVKVSDTGDGIHPEDLPHLFKRFYRSPFEPDAQGAGLGLPLAKAIVEAHGGTIEVDSTLGKGTCFTLNFRIPTKL